MPTPTTAVSADDSSQHDGRRQQLLHSEARNPGGQLLRLVTPQAATGSMGAWRLLLQRLSLWVGHGGSAAILVHSIQQITPQFSALAILHPQYSWPEQLAQLQHNLQQLPPAVAGLAQLTLWHIGSQLIYRLFGTTLSPMLLDQEHHQPGIHRYG